MAASEQRVAVLVPPAEWGVGDIVDPSVFAAMTEDDMLTELERLEQLTAWLAARALSMTEQLLTVRRRDAVEDLLTRRPHATTAECNLESAEAASGLEDEIALATGVSVHTAHTRAAMVAHDPERAAPVREALARGDLSWERAARVFNRAGAAPAEAMPAIVDAVVAPYPARSLTGVGGLRVPHKIFTARLHRQIAKITTAAQRHRSEIEDRTTYAVLDPDGGVGTLTITGHAARVAGAHDRIDDIARRLRREGDTRTLAQLRSDIALDLMLYGHIPVPSTLPALDGTGESIDIADLVAAYDTFDGQLPPAMVHVTVSLSALMGASDEPGTLDYGGRQEWMCAQVVREAALAAGSTWKRLVTDPATGYMVDLSTKSYAITGELRERILARDRISRAPGSTTPARLCDTDHDIDFAKGGPSSESNVSAKHRRGHNHKTRHTWQCHREPGVNGHITWTTPTDRTYTTLPWDYRDPDSPTPEQLRANLQRSTLVNGEAVQSGEPADADAGRIDAGRVDADRIDRRGYDLDYDAPALGDLDGGVVRTTADAVPTPGTGTAHLDASSTDASGVPTAWGEVRRIDPAVVRRHADDTGMPLNESFIDIALLIDDARSDEDAVLAAARRATEDQHAFPGIRTRTPRQRRTLPHHTPWSERQAGPPPF